ncbi:MAG: chemotaxis protein CheW [Candidatus Tectimicrobiota bacterium]
MVVEQTAGARRWLRCVAAGQTYALALAYVSSIQRPEQCRWQPGPRGPLALLPGAGRAIPVVRLAACLAAAPTASSLSGRLLVLKAQPHPWALHVDSLEGVIQMASEAVYALPDLGQAPATCCFDAVLAWEDQFLLSLAPAGLCPAGLSVPAAPYHPIPRPVTHLPPAPQVGGQLLSFRTLEHAPHDPPWCFALSLSQIAQLLYRPPFVPVPGLAPGIVGLTWWRDALLGVIDLSQRLGGAASPLDPTRRLLVVRAAATRAFVSFAVWPDVHLWRLPLAHRPSERQFPFQPALICGQFDLEHTTLVIPDINRLLPQRMAG